MGRDLNRRVTILILSDDAGVGTPEPNRRGTDPRISVRLGSLSLPSFVGDHHQMTARDAAFEPRRLETGNTPGRLPAPAEETGTNRGLIPGVGIGYAGPDHGR